MTTPVTNTTSPRTETPSAQDRIPQKNLGQNDFLKLLSVQLAQQDPLDPVDNADFMAQMAQFSALEQSTTLATQMTAMRYDTSFQAAAALIGREVSYETTEGETITGQVTAVEPQAKGVFLEVNGAFISLDAVVRVAPPTVTVPNN